MSEEAEWIALNIPGRVTVGESTAPCQVVTISTEGLVILPALKGQAGMNLIVEFHPQSLPRPIRITAVVAREGAYHGNYALQVQYDDQVTAEAEAAILKLLGYDVEVPDSEVQSGDVLTADEAKDMPKDKGLRSYTELLADLPEMEVDDVTPANYDDSGKLPAVERDLLEDVDERSLKKIYKEALSQMKNQDKPKKKKGWFG